MILHHFHDTCIAEATQRLRVAVFATTLSYVQCVSHVILYRPRELTQVSKA
jgi:hypothetical protein